MSDREPLVAPEYTDHGGTLLFLAQRLAGTEQGDLEVDVYQSGFFLEAVVRRTSLTEPSTTVLTERITLMPTFQAWLKDLLDRAEKEN